MRLSITLLLLCASTSTILAQGRIISTFPYRQSFSFVPAGTSAQPDGPIGSAVFPRDTADGGEFTADEETPADWVNAVTTGLNNNAGTGGAIRVQTSGSTSPTNAQGFYLHLDLTGRIAGSVSLTWAKVQNGTSTRRNELRIAASAEGRTFMDLGGTSFDNSARDQAGTLRVELPSSLDGIDEVRIWVYSINVSGTGAHPRVVIDDLAVTATNDNALPVELALFSVAWAETGPLLMWRTASESGNLGFEVQRGRSDTALTPIASFRSAPELRGLGTSAIGREYSFLDELPEDLRNAGGTVRYRLVSIDAEGTQYTSATRTLRIPGAGARDSASLLVLSIPGVVPHPIESLSLVTLRIPAPTTARLEVVDVGGGVRRAWNLGQTAPGERRQEIDLDGLPPGIYALRLTTTIGIRTRLITVR